MRCTISACCGIACGGKVPQKDAKKRQRISSPPSNVICAAPGAAGDSERAVKCLLVGADAALPQSTAGTAQATSYLDRAAPLIEALPGGSELAAEYHYRRLQLASQAGDDAARLQHADWLVNHAAGSPFELAGLVAAAKAADAKIEAAGPAEKSTLQQESYALYQRLSQHLGDDPEVLKRTKNCAGRPVQESELRVRVREIRGGRSAARSTGRRLSRSPGLPAARWPRPLSGRQLREIFGGVAYTTSRFAKGFRCLVRGQIPSVGLSVPDG